MRVRRAANRATSVAACARARRLSCGGPHRCAQRGTRAQFPAHATRLPPTLGFLANGVAAGGQLTTTTDIENFLGFPDGISGMALTDTFAKQSARFGTTIKPLTVTKVDLSSRPFKVWTEGGEDGAPDALASTLIVATGASPKKLIAEGAEKYWQKGAHCGASGRRPRGRCTLSRFAAVTAGLSGRRGVKRRVECFHLPLASPPVCPCALTPRHVSPPALVPQASARARRAMASSSRARSLPSSAAATRRARRRCTSRSSARRCALWLGVKVQGSGVCTVLHDHAFAVQWSARSIMRGTASGVLANVPSAGAPLGEPARVPPTTTQRGPLLTPPASKRPTRTLAGLPRPPPLHAARVRHHGGARARAP